MEESSRQRLFIEAKNEETGERRPGDYVGLVPRRSGITGARERQREVQQETELASLQ